MPEHFGPHGTLLEEDIPANQEAFKLHPCGPSQAFLDLLAKELGHGVVQTEGATVDMELECKAMLGKCMDKDSPTHASEPEVARYHGEALTSYEQEPLQQGASSRSAGASSHTSGPMS